MGLRELAEGIILQSIEDLWSEDLAGECMEFFRGRDFRICAELAKMNLIDQVKLLNLVKDGIQYRRKASVRESGLIQKGKKGRPFRPFLPRPHNLPEQKRV